MAELYIKYIGDKPVAYAYGDEWVSQALFMDDIGYPDAETAKAAWISGHVDGVAHPESEHEGYEDLMTDKMLSEW